MTSKAKDIYVIGDTQTKKGVRNPLIPVAHDIGRTLPDIVVHLGDHWDLPSLCSYNKGKNSFVSERYVEDIEAGNKAMYEFWDIISMYQAFNPSWKCEFIILEGNHEYRRNKAIDEAPIQYADLFDYLVPDYSGWDKVVSFLEIIEIQGICFSHYFVNEFTGRPIGSAKMTLNKRHRSFVMGHKQILDYEEQPALNGGRIQGLVIGACYFHDEEYKTPQGQNHFRGCALLKNAHDGEWELDIRTLRTLDEKMIAEFGTYKELL